MHQVSWCEVICVVMIALLLPAGVLWPPLMWTAHVLCSIMPGILQHTAASPLTCLGVWSSLMAVISSRALLEEDYRKVLEVRLKASLPASSAGCVHLCVGAPNVIMCVCRLDLSGLLQGKLQSLSSAASTADTETNRPSCMVRGRQYC